MNELEQTQKSECVEIVVTDKMIRAGLEEISEHKFGADLGYILECVFRAMGYANSEASSSNSRQ